MFCEYVGEALLAPAVELCMLGQTSTKFVVDAVLEVQLLLLRHVIHELLLDDLPQEFLYLALAVFRGLLQRLHLRFIDSLIRIFIIPLVISYLYVLVVQLVHVRIDPLLNLVDFDICSQDVVGQILVMSQLPIDFIQVGFSQFQSIIEFDFQSIKLLSVFRSGYQRDNLLLDQFPGYIMRLFLHPWYDLYHHSFYNILLLMELSQFDEWAKHLKLALVVSRHHRILSDLV